MKAKEFTGEAWSSDDNQSFYYKITLNKDDAVRLIKMMDVYKELHNKYEELDLYSLIAWDASAQIFNDEECTDEQYCDVCKVVVQENGIMFELKDKYCANVYETMDIMRSDLEEIIKEG